MSDLTAVERAIGYKFKDISLLERALTLSSYDNAVNNESLECLGDALLTFIVAEKYYGEGLSEGGITEKKQQYLADEALKPVSERLGLADALRRGKGDEGNKKAVPSAYEAVAGAIYLDGGLEEARKFALSTLAPLKNPTNYVALLQEYLQDCKEPLPVYDKQISGTPQNPEHTVTVSLHGKTFKGTGANFSEAKRCCAKSAYEFLTKNSSDE